MRTLLAAFFWLFMAVSAVGQVAPASSIRTYDNMSTLLSINPVSITADSKATIAIRGYYLPGDGGGGNFFYDKTSTATVDNGIFFAPANGIGRYIRVETNNINVKMFGAKGDGLTDDADAIQRTIDFAGTIPNIPTGLEVFVPRGSYALGKTIHIPAGIWFHGENSQYTTLLYGIPGASFTDNVIVDVHEDGQFVVAQGVRIEDLDIRGSDAVNAHAMRIRRGYDNVECNRLTIKNVSTNYSALVVTTNFVGQGPLSQGLKFESCYFARNLSYGSQVPLVDLFRVYESTFIGCKFFAEPGSATPTSSVVIRIRDCRGVSFFGGGIAEALIGIEIVSTVAPCVGITIDDSVTFESIYKFVTVNGTGITQYLNMGNFRYQFGNNPDMVLEATNLTHSIIHDNVGFGVSIQGVSSVRNWIYAGPIFQGLAVDYPDSGGTNALVYLSNPLQNTVIYNATAAGQITTFDRALGINSDNTPLLLLTVTARTNNYRISYGATTNGTDAGLTLRSGDGESAMTVDNLRTSVRHSLRISDLFNPLIDFRLTGYLTNDTPTNQIFIPAITNNVNIVWLVSSSTPPGELQFRLDGIAGFSMFDPTVGVLTNLSGLTNNTYLKMRTTAAGLSTGEPIEWDPISGVLFLRSLNLPSGGSGATNGSAVWLGNSFLSNVELNDSSEINVGVTGTNATWDLIDGTISTNRIDANFHTLLIAGGGGGSGTDLQVNSGGVLAAASLNTSSTVSFSEGSGNITAGIVDGSLSTNKIDVNFHTLLIAGGGGVSYDFTNGVTNSAGTVHSALLEGANISLTTNAGGAITIAAVISTNSGTSLQVNNGGVLSAASLDTSTFISFAESGGSVTASLVNASISTNKLDAQTYALLIATGGGGSGTNIFVGASTLVEPAHLIGSVNATWAVTDATNISVTFTGVGSATNGYVMKSVTAITNVGGDGEVAHMNVTIPGGTLSEDGDELIFYVPGAYRNYLDTTTDYLSWAFRWTDKPETLTDYNSTNVTVNTSTFKGVTWENRIKRINATNFIVWTEYTLEDADNVGNQRIINSVRWSEMVDMDVFSFANDLTFELAVTIESSADPDDILTTYGYTILKPASVGGSEGGGDPSLNVLGPASSTTNAVALFNGITGKLIKNSSMTIDGNGVATNTGSIGAPEFFVGTTNVAVEIELKAPIASPSLTGNPTSQTPSADDNDTSIATTAFVQGELILNVLPSVPSASTNHVLDFLYSAMTFSVTNNVNMLQSTNRPANATNAAFTILRLAGDTVDRTLSWNASWKRLGTNITTIPSNKVVVLSAMVTGTSETNVTFGLAKEE